ncbi:hypothetical protein DH2020_023284 [Rehmannia glutinosa]|uniref:C2H2-type domain-containing protein n=1 Tax=Rehmannia glutinosa TaxID=99300 RepID=A0ABR0W8H9_REHGL
MRAHGIGDENYSLDNDDACEEKFVGSDYRTSTKRMYGLRTNPNRLKNCRICEHCGEEFLSWKSFLEHGRCNSGDTSKSLVSSTESEGDDDDGRQSGGWGKRKRSLRIKSGSILSANYPSSEELEEIHVARCLLQLSNVRVNPPVAEPSTTSASLEEKERRNLILERTKGALSSGPKNMFECKACKKVFNSHQALGGHRASHKKVKGCYYATKQEQEDEISLAQDNNIGTPHDEEALLIFPSKPTSSFQFEQGPPLLGAKKRKSNKVHECSICGRVFSSGQALGGHKRCHWITTSISPYETSSLNKLRFQDNINEPIQHRHYSEIAQSDNLGLNITTWADDMHLNSWITKDQEKKEDNNKNGNEVSDRMKVDNKIDEELADNKLKLAKLINELEDIENKGNSSQWLQVGIGSTNHV